MIALPKLEDWPEDWFKFRQQIEFKLSSGLDKLLKKQNQVPKVEFVSQFKKRPEESRTYPESTFTVTSLVIEHAPTTVDELIKYFRDPDDWPNLENVFLFKEVDRRLIEIKVNVPVDCCFEDGKFSKELTLQKRYLQYYSRDTLFIQDRDMWSDDYTTLLEKVTIGRRDILEQGKPKLRFVRGEKGGVQVITPEDGFLYEEVGPCVTFDPMEDYSKWMMKKVIYVTDDITSRSFIDKCEQFRQMVNKGTDFEVLLPDCFVNEKEDVILWSEKYIRPILNAPGGSILHFNYSRMFNLLWLNCRLCVLYLLTRPNIKILFVTHSEREGLRAIEKIEQMLTGENIKRRGPVIQVNNGGSVTCTYRNFHHLYDQDLIILNEPTYYHPLLLQELRLRLKPMGKIVVTHNVWGDDRVGRDVIFEDTSKL